MKIFKECCGILILCGRVAIQKAVEVNYRAVCLEVYFRIPAFSYTLSILSTQHSAHHHITIITQRDLYFTILLLLELLLYDYMVCLW